MIDEEPPKMSSSYYSGVNPELLVRVPITAKHILEIGCGVGNFGRAYLARNPSAQYVGVELFEGAAQQASAHLSHVIVGDIEQPDIKAALTDVSSGELFDTLVFGDVLEHLRDPWRVLVELRARVAEGGTCIACIPNVAHWSVLQQQLNGRWDYGDAGLLDRTHLRFFTLDTAIEMFRKAGWTVIDATPRIVWPEKTEAAIKALSPLAIANNIAPEKFSRDLSAFQWVIRAANGSASSPLTVAAIGLQESAGVSEPRVDHPIAALSTLPAVRAVWGAGDVSVPKGWLPGIILLHRRIWNADFLESTIAQGWVIVADMDDDPYRFPAIVERNFDNFRSVHAVTVTTDHLAEIVRQWNPHVEVFPNAVYELPQVSSTTPKQGERVRVFFGALNRGPDWTALMPALISVAQELLGKVEFVVVHDQMFFDGLPESVAKEFHPTLPHKAYMATLSGCDIALLPLNDNAFNRCKSDLKFIECCAAGVVPICSPVVYGERAIHGQIGVFAETPEDWRKALVDLCSDTADIQRRRALGLNYVRTERMQSQQVVARESYYRKLHANRADLEAQRSARLRALQT